MPDVAIPEALVLAEMLLVPLPLNVPLAPLPGAVKVTGLDGITTLAASSTRTCKAEAKAVETPALWLLPLVMAIEAGVCTTVAESVALALAAAPPPDNVPLNDRDTDADAPIATLSVRGLPLLPAVITLALVQLTVEVPLQLHPVPLELERLVLAGNVIAKVNVPEVLATVALGVTVSVPVWP